MTSTATDRAPTSAPTRHRRRMQSAILCAALAAMPSAACSQASADAPTYTYTPVTDADQFNGEWEVARFDDYTPPSRMDGLTRIAIADFRLDYDYVDLRIGCAQQVSYGGFQDGRFVATPPPVGLELDTSECTKEELALDTKYRAFFKQNPKIEISGDDRLRLTAGSSELLLERPSLRMRANAPDQAELTGTWQLGGVYMRSFGRIDVRSLWDAPGAVGITDKRIVYTLCPDYAVAIRYEDGQLKAPEGTQPPEDAKCSPPNYAKADEAPTLGDIMYLFASSPAVESVGDDRILLTAKGIELLMKRKVEE